MVYTTRPGEDFALPAVAATVRDRNGVVAGAQVEFRIDEIEDGEAPEPEEPGEDDEPDTDDPGSSSPASAGFGGVDGPKKVVVTSSANGLATPPPVRAGLGLGVLRITVTATRTIAGKPEVATDEGFLRVQAVMMVLSAGYGGTGELGNGSTRNSPIPSGVSIPAGVGSIRLIGTSPNRKGWAVDASGTLWGWGSDAGHVQASRGTKTTPQPIHGLPTDIAQVAGTDKATYVLTEDGHVWAWGSRVYYAMGDGNNKSEQLTPVRLANLSNVTKIAASTRTVYAIDGDGALWVWGHGNYGSLGLGSAGGDAQIPTRIAGFPPGRKVVDIGGRYNGATAVLDDGTVWGWGHNGHGAIGDGTVTNRTVPTRVPGIDTAVRVDTGWYNTSVVLADATVRAWGRGNYYNMGLGDTTRRVSPVDLGLTHVHSMAWGCETGHALLTDGSVLGWGYNGNYEVGAGVKESRTKVPRVLPGVKATAIASTQYATFMLQARD
ncbi:RCC1 domain-containing protein [Leifsonia shinshuensis]